MLLQLLLNTLPYSSSASEQYSSPSLRSYPLFAHSWIKRSCLIICASSKCSLLSSTVSFKLCS